LCTDYRDWAEVLQDFGLAVSDDRLLSFAPAFQQINPPNNKTWTKIPQSFITYVKDTVEKDEVVSSQDSRVWKVTPCTYTLLKGNVFSAAIPTANYGCIFFFMLT
jgi:hypothetical protein